MNILIYGNKELNKPSEDISEINDDIKKLADEMYTKMFDANGIGLAAPQIGKHIKLIVIDTREEDGIGRLNLINPEIIDVSNETIVMDEGCLSVPGIYAPVRRPTAIRVRYKTLQGRKMTINATGMLSRVIQHEIDHLKGILFVENIEDQDILVSVKPLLEKLKRGEKVAFRNK